MSTITSAHRADVIEILRDERATIVEVQAPTVTDLGVLVAHGRYDVRCPLRGSRSSFPVTHGRGRTIEEAIEETRASWADELAGLAFVCAVEFADDVIGVPV